MIESEEKKEEVGKASVEPAVDAEAPGSFPQEESTLQEMLKKEKEAAKEAQGRYLRTLADFENFKKRAKKEQSDLVKYGNERVMKEMLPVIDNLERAISHSKETQDFGKMVEGVTLIQKQFVSVLEKFGVRPIESLNQPFDPFHHQSVGQVEVEADSETEENQIINETQKGYFINERVLRPSLVVLAKLKPALSPKEANETNETSSAS